MNRKILIVAAAFAAVVVLLGAQAVMAGLITFANPSFELPPLSGNAEVQDQMPTGWDYDANASAIYLTNNQQATYGTPPAGNGTQYMEYKNGTGLFTNSGVALIPGSTYTLSFWASSGGGNSNLNGALLASDNTVDEGSTILVNSYFSTTAGTWTQFTADPVTYSGPAGKYLSVALCTPSGGGAWCAFDNMSVTVTPAPEPSMMALLSAGLVGLLAYAWRKRK